MNNSRIAIAKITSVHGIKGLVKLSLFEEELTLFSKPLFIDSTNTKTLEITLKNRIKKQYLAEVSGITDRTAAEKLIGTTLYTDRDNLDQETAAHFDMIGLPTFTKQGQEMGEIIRIQNFGASDLIEIKPLNGGSFFLPFTEQCVLDITKDKVIIDPPEYI